MKWFRQNDSAQLNEPPSDILHYFATPPKITHVRFFSISDDLCSPGLRWRAKHGHCMECPHGKPSPNVLQGLCNESTQRTKVCLYIILGYQDVSYFVHKKSAKLNELNKMEGTKKHVVVTVCFLTKSPASKFRSSVRGWRRSHQLAPAAFPGSCILHEAIQRLLPPGNRYITKQYPVQTNTLQIFWGCSRRWFCMWWLCALWETVQW